MTTFHIHSAAYKRITLHHDLQRVRQVSQGQNNASYPPQLVIVLLFKEENESSLVIVTMRYNAYNNGQCCPSEKEGNQSEEVSSLV